MSLTQYFAKKAKMNLPKCDFCILTAQYDFVDDGGEWRYGCTSCWMKYRASKQIGPGHCRHLTSGMNPPPRPEGYVPKPVDPNRLVKPRVAPTLATYTAKTGVASSGGSSTLKEPKAPRTKLSRDFQDMEATGADIKEPRPGSVLAITLDLIKEKGGATLDEINTAIGPKHDALKLIQWAHENKGYGWKMDPETKKIQVSYYAKESA